MARRSWIVTRAGRARWALAAVAASACLASHHAGAQATVGEAGPPSAAPPQAATASEPATAPRGERGRRDQASADRIIAVARDVSPEWARSLEEVRARNPEGFERATGTMAKRLKSLAVLKERKPQLYALRVEELRIQGEVSTLAAQWRSAIETGRTEESAALQAQLRERVGKMVDLNLRSRAMELAELDQVMRTMRSDLERDARARDATVDGALESYRRGEEPEIGRNPVDAPPAEPPAGGAASAPAAPAPSAPAAAAPGAKPASAPAPAPGSQP